MLTWDEEVKPSSQNQLDGGLPQNRQGRQRLAAATFAATRGRHANSKPPATLPHRSHSSPVNAADKRIINGQTDVNQLGALQVQVGMGKYRRPPAPTTGCPKR